jgi:hypothetical protein
MLYSVRVSGSFADRRQKLEAAGVNFTPQRGGPLAVLTAFKTYKAVFNHLKVPKK